MPLGVAKEYAIRPGGLVFGIGFENLFLLWTFHGAEFMTLKPRMLRIQFEKSEGLRDLLVLLLVVSAELSQRRCCRVRERQLEGHARLLRVVARVLRERAKILNPAIPNVINPVANELECDLVLV